MARNRFRSRCQLSKYRIGKTTPLVTICSVPVRFLRIGNLRLIRQVSLFFCLLFFSVGTQAAESLITLEHDSSFRQVYLIPDISSDLIQVTVVFTVGEVDYDGPEGLSHYLEHLMFWHADKVNDEPYHARGGNAWVNGILSSYYNSGQASELNDMFAFVRRLFEAPDLERRFMLDERKVVAREYDFRVSENPDRRAITRLRKRLYAQHPISRSVIGTPSSIMQQSVEEANRFHQQFYHPANAILIVSGPISPAQLLAQVNKVSPDLQGGPRHEQRWRDATIDGVLDARETFFDPQIKQDRLISLSLANHTFQHDRMQVDYTGQLLQTILTSALPGGLAKPLRLDQFVFRGFDLHIFGLLNNQIEIQFFAEPDEGLDLHLGATRYVEALQSLASNGIPAQTIERVRTRTLQREARLEKNADHVFWRANRHLSLGFAPNSWEDHRQRIESVTKADLDAMLRSIAFPARRAFGLLVGNQ